MWKRILFLIILLIVVCLAFFGQQSILITTEPVRIVNDIDALNSLDPAKTVAVIPKGQRLRVTACRNLVDDQVYHVITESGVQGYVAGGRFTIERKPYWRSPCGKIVICY